MSPHIAPSVQTKIGLSNESIMNLTKFSSEMEVTCDMVLFSRFSIFISIFSVWRLWFEMGGLRKDINLTFFVKQFFIGSPLNNALLTFRYRLTSCCNLKTFFYKIRSFRETLTISLNSKTPSSTFMTDVKISLINTIYFYANATENFKPKYITFSLLKNWNLGHAFSNRINYHLNKHDIQRIAAIIAN